MLGKVAKQRRTWLNLRQKYGSYELMLLYCRSLWSGLNTLALVALVSIN